MSVLDQIRYKCNEHSRRAISEGRGPEAHFLALLMEILEMNFADVQGKANALLDKLSQLEADTKDLVAKSGGTAAVSAAPPGNLVTDDQMNSFVAVLDQIGIRLDMLKDEVVHGTPAPTAVPETPSPSTPPVTAVAPAEGSGTSTPTSSSPVPSTTPSPAPPTSPTP